MSFMNSIKYFLHKYRHGWVFLYVFVYVPWFMYLERRTDVTPYILHCPLDGYIPLVPAFIIPYVLWFLFVPATILYFFFRNKKAFYQLVIFLFTGMTLFLILCTIFPNGIDLRPQNLPCHNIFDQVLSFLWSKDTDTNVCPSIHVYNTLGVVLSVSRNINTKRHWLASACCYVLAALIILSTLFLKQHSVIDVAAAFIMAALIYPLAYRKDKKGANAEATA